MNGALTKGIPFAEYCAIDAEHSSTLKSMLVSPLHYKHAREVPRADAATLRLGRAVHTSVLEPDRFPIDFTVYTESKNKGKGSVKAWEAFQAANTNRSILDEEEYERALAIRNAVRRSSRAMELLSEGDGEVTAQWAHEATGLACKARFDWCGPKGIVDLKTTRGIDVAGFSRDVANYAYHLQFALYCDGYETIAGEAPPFWVVSVESTAPHDVVVYRVPEALIQRAWVTVQNLLENVKRCRTANHWPGVAGDQVVELALPAWAEQGAAQ